MDRELSRLVCLLVDELEADNDEIEALCQVVKERLRFDAATPYNETPRGKAALERARAGIATAPVPPPPTQPAVMPEGTTVPPEPVPETSDAS